MKRFLVDNRFTQLKTTHAPKTNREITVENSFIVYNSSWFKQSLSILNE